MQQDFWPFTETISVHTNWSQESTVCVCVYVGKFLLNLWRDLPNVCTINSCLRNFSGIFYLSKYCMQHILLKFLNQKPDAQMLWFGQRKVNKAWGKLIYHILHVMRLSCVILCLNYPTAYWLVVCKGTIIHSICQYSKTITL